MRTTRTSSPKLAPRRRGGVVTVPIVMTLLGLSLFPACRSNEEAKAAGRPRVELRATVLPIDATGVFAPFEGRVESVAVRDGAQVRAGDVLVTLANPAVDREIAHASAQLALAEYRLRTASRTSAATPSQQAGEREKAVASIMRNKKAKLDRMRQLFATRDVAELELREAENEYAAARREWLGERERLFSSPPPADLQILRLEAERARADAAAAADRKTSLSVRAPSDGTVVRIHAVPGRPVFGRDTLVELANPTTVMVRAEIAPELLRYVREGMPIDVKVFTVPPRSFREPIARVIPPDVPGGPAVAVAVPNPDRTLQAGTPAVITLQ